MIMRPFCPCLCEVLENELAEGFAVVGHDLYIAVNKFLYVVLEFVPSLLELWEEIWGIVSLTYLIRVVEEGMRIWCICLLEGIADML